ncbi:MAG: DUF4384 domain-containing protein, partial [Planctomycetaceae bacterium]
MSAVAVLPLLIASAIPQVQYGSVANDPSVRVWLDEDGRYERGDRARIHVQSDEDGYLVVLHADPQGRVRILFPLDPGDDDFVRGAETYEILGRGDRDAFLVDERTGSGIVLAAWSPDPFRFDGLVRGDHWDYRAIAPAGVADDPEVGLLGVVHGMAPDASFAYDAEPYIVGEPRYADGGGAVSIRVYDPWCAGCFRAGYSTRSGFHLGVSFGVFGSGPWWHAGLYHYAFLPYHHRWYRPAFYGPYFGWRPYRVHYYDPVFWISGPRFRHRGIGVHLRFAGGTCRFDPFCRDRFDHGRPGLATGIFTGPLDP